MTVLGVLKKYGACEDLASESQIDRLLFDPRGIEYLENANIPLSIFRDFPQKGIFVDTTIKAENENVVLVNSTAKIVLSGVDQIYRIVLLHGSTADIEAYNYAVVQIVNIDGKFKLTKDKTVVTL